MFQNVSLSILILFGILIGCPILIYLYIRMGTTAYFDGKFKSIKNNLHGDKQCQKQETDENGEE